MSDLTSWLKLFIMVLLVSSVLGACAMLPPNDQRTETHHFTDMSDTRLGNEVLRGMRAHTGLSGYFLLPDGLDAFVARAFLATYAEKSIDTQYYMIHSDLVGSLFIDQLIKAADRGVRVRLLIDDIDEDGKDARAFILDSHPNIEVRIFNPFGRNTGRTMQYVTGFGKQTRRAHNKSFTVDNAATILGGRNIGNEYFRADPELAFLDLDVLAVGPVAEAVSSSFDQYWNNKLSYPVSVLIKDLPTVEESKQRIEEFNQYIAQQSDSEYLYHLKHSNLTKNIQNNSIEYFWGEGLVVADSPDKLLHDTSETQYHLSKQLQPYLDGIEKELLIFSPYFVPGKSGVAYFEELRSKGVRVKILTNSLSSNDVAVVHSGYSNYRRALLRSGVELYELNQKLNKDEKKEKKEGGLGRSKSSLHAKAFVFDQEKVFIGSLNLDPRSLIQNTEIGVVIDSEEMAKIIADSFNANIEKIAFRVELLTDTDGKEFLAWHGLVDGEPKTFYREPYTSWWQRFVSGFMSILPGESQL